MIDWQRVRAELQRYPQQGDVCLYRIGLHAGLLGEADLNRIQGGHLPSDLRSRVLGWLRMHAEDIG